MQSPGTICIIGVVDDAYIGSTPDQSPTMDTSTPYTRGLKRQVTIPADSSYIALTQDTEVSTLSMSGGALVTHDTTCLPGWTSAPGGTATSFGASKCYKLFSEPLLWGEAQSACASAVSRQEASETSCKKVVLVREKGRAGGDKSTIFDLKKCG